MTATTLDLRYRTHDLFASLARGVQITITYRGRKAGILLPYHDGAKATDTIQHVCDHPYFGSAAPSTRTVAEEVDLLRGGRFNDL
jgi:antitoxin (DNA-binding transcriptional repressor) of toxin-antitoxin stability system